MNVLDNHITDIDKRIKDICQIAPTLEGPSIQESLSSYGWILLDSWIAWRTLRFLIKDQEMKPDIQKKWFQTPSSFSASQIRAVWQFGDNLDSFLNQRTSHGLRYLIDEEIEKARNFSAHFSTGGVINGSDYQKISSYYNLFSNIFLLYEIFSFYVSLSTFVVKSEESSLTMIDGEGKNIFEYSNGNQPIDYNLKIIDLETVSVVKISFYKKGKSFFLNFDRDGCYLNDEFESRIGEFNIFTNKGYYRDISLIKERLKKLEYL